MSKLGHRAARKSTVSRKHAPSPRGAIAASTADAESLGRRDLLAKALGIYIASLLPECVLAQPVANSDQARFVALSAILVGRASLDANQSARLYEALVSEDPSFSVSVSALLNLIESRKVDPLQLQATLDAEKSPLAPLPRKVVTAWYIGVVGEGERARCIAFEMALNAAVVADVLKPPTYCYGPYGSWARKPT